MRKWGSELQRVHLQAKKSLSPHWKIGGNIYVSFVKMKCLRGASFSVILLCHWLPGLPAVGGTALTPHSNGWWPSADSPDPQTQSEASGSPWSWGCVDLVWSEGRLWGCMLHNSHGAGSFPSRPCSGLPISCRMQEQGPHLAHSRLPTNIGPQMKKWKVLWAP